MSFSVFFFFLYKRAWLTPIIPASGGKPRIEVFDFSTSFLKLKWRETEKGKKVKIFPVSVSDMTIVAWELLTFGSSGVLQPQHIPWLRRHKGAWVWWGAQPDVSLAAREQTTACARHWTKNCKLRENGKVCRYPAVPRGSPCQQSRSTLIRVVCLSRGEHSSHPSRRRDPRLSGWSRLSSWASHFLLSWLWKWQRTNVTRLVCNL